MNIDKIVIAGAGGHGKVVIDAVRAAWGDAFSIRLCDGNPTLAGQTVMGVPVDVPIQTCLSDGGFFHVAIGNPTHRSAITRSFTEAGMTPCTVAHPRACVSPSARVAEGCFIAATAVVGPCAEIGPGCIVNHGAVVDHDCRVGAFCHIAPNAALGGGVSLGDSVLIGAGACVLPGLTIGDRCVVGAGAVVTTSLPSDSKHAGVPARPLEDRT